jgi:hypothetical protein
MACETIQTTLVIGVVVFSVLAGGAWLRAATAKVRAPKEHGKPVEFRLSLAYDGSYQLIANGVDVARTLALQSKWNTAAAAFACVAAIFQALQASPIAKLLLG